MECSSITYYNVKQSFMMDIRIFLIYQNTTLSIGNSKNKSRGGVAIYIRKTIEYKLREDLDIFIEGEL